MIACPECGSENDETAQECANCHKSLHLVPEKPSRVKYASWQQALHLNWPMAFVPRQPIQIARAIPLLILCVALCAPWYVTDLGDPGFGFILAADLCGWTLGVCGLPYVLLLLPWTIVILTPVRGKMPGMYYAILWVYRGMLLLWLAEMNTNFFTKGVIGWNVDYSGYWGPKLFTIGVALALPVEMVAIFAGSFRKARAALNPGK